MPSGQDGIGRIECAVPEPLRIVDCAATVMSMDPKWGHLRLTTGNGSIEFRITEGCAEDLIIDLQNFLAATAISHS